MRACSEILWFCNIPPAPGASAKIKSFSARVGNGFSQGVEMDCGPAHGGPPKTEASRGMGDSQQSKLGSGSWRRTASSLTSF